MSPFTNDQKEYASLLITSRQKSNRRLATALLLFSLFVGMHTLQNFTPGTSVISQAFPAVLLIVVSLYFLVQSLATNAVDEKVLIEGTFILKQKRRSTFRYLDKKSILLPAAWIDYFEPHKQYGVEAVEVRNFIGRKEYIVLRVKDLPQHLADIKLIDMLDAEHYLKNIVWKTYLLVFGIVLIPVGGIYILVHNRPLLELVVYFLADTGKEALKVYSLVTILMFIGLIIAIRMIRLRLKAQNIDLQYGMKWKAWIMEYQQFMENDLLPLMQNNDKTAELLVKQKSTMIKHKRFHLEYLKYKRVLYGPEKDEFVQVFKETNRKVKKGNYASR